MGYRKISSLVEDVTTSRRPSRLTARVPTAIKVGRMTQDDGEAHVQRRRTIIGPEFCRFTSSSFAFDSLGSTSSIANRSELTKWSRRCRSCAIEASRFRRFMRRFSVLLTYEDTAARVRNSRLPPRHAAAQTAVGRTPRGRRWNNGGWSHLNDFDKYNEVTGGSRKGEILTAGSDTQGHH